MKRLAAFFIIGGLLVAGCSESFTPVPGEPFSMQVTPEQISEAILDQKFVFLVTVEEEGEETNGGTSVFISASADDAVVIVYPQSITTGEVSEITVSPFEVNSERVLTVFFEGWRDGLEETDSISFELTDFEDQLASDATEMRDKFIPWLEQNYTEFGITSETLWTGTIVLPDKHLDHLVSYYLFFSQEWEMGVEWLTMSAPVDDVHIYLRRRFTETTPSYAFAINSYSEPDPVPFVIFPPDRVYR